MGKPTGFLDFDRRTAGYQPVEERLKHYNEFTKPLAKEELERQGARCMDCGIPFCHAMGCPVSNLIPEWNDMVFKGQWREAYERLEMTNNLPEVTGRICPAPCECSCTLSINDAPVTIKAIELAIIERAFAEGWVKPRPPQQESGKSVAVIGSGPAGLAAAQQIRRMGHKVTLFEKSAKIGGILRYGIPDFKLEKWVLDRRIKQMEEEGVVFETNVTIGEDLSTSFLQRKFDAILFTVGAGAPRDLPVPGRELAGVHYAMEFLTRNNRHVGGEIRADELISAKGKRVLVIGGGDTGSDCVGTSNRHGALSVHQFEIMPKPRDWQEPSNPVWPNWPQILRTSSSHDEGCERRWSILTKQFSAGADGRVNKAHFVEVEWKSTTPGKPPVPVEIAGSEFTLDVDLVLLAMGFVHVEHSKLLNDFGVQYDERGNIKTDGNYKTTVEGLFAAGDSHAGASLVVRAIDHGRKSAEAVNAYLS